MTVTCVVIDEGVESCGKVPYVSAREAKQALDRLPRRHASPKSSNRRLRPYSCGRCGFYHLGHR